VETVKRVVSARRHIASLKEGHGGYYTRATLFTNTSFFEDMAGAASAAFEERHTIMSLSAGRSILLVMKEARFRRGVPSSAISSAQGPIECTCSVSDKCVSARGGQCSLLASVQASPS
jgi:hypothetical protein